MGTSRPNLQLRELMRCVGIFDRVKAVKRPEGMHREVFALLYNDNKDAPPLLPTDTGLLPVAQNKEI